MTTGIRCYHIAVMPQPLLHLLERCPIFEQQRSTRKCSGNAVPKRLFLFFLIIVLTYSVIDLLATFAGTVCLIPALVLSVLLITAIAGYLCLWNDQLREPELIVTNAADRPIKTIGDALLTTTADAAAHGYGIKSMRQAAEQVHGMLIWR